jgi:hypothetical protein
MKSFIILILILAIAWFTLPTEGKFGKYLTKKEKDKDKCQDGLRHYSYKLFTIDYVDYCEGALSAHKTRTDKYLGLFGTFWKL